MAVKITPEARQTLSSLHPWHRILTSEPALFNALAGEASLPAQREKLRTALRLAHQIRKRDAKAELLPVVRAAAAVHNHLGTRAALSFLHSALHEAHTGQPLELQPPVQGRAGKVPPRRVLAKLLRLKQEKPSQILADVTEILGKSPNQLSHTAMQHSSLLWRASGVLSWLANVISAHNSVSKKTGLDKEQVHKDVFPLYDKAHEKLSSHVSQGLYGIFEELATGPLDQKGFKKAVSLLDKAIDEVAAAYQKKLAKSHWLSPPTVFNATRLELIPPGGERGKNPPTVAKLEEALKKRVEEYQRREY